MTDSRLEFTNRSRQRLRLRAAVGAAADPDTALATIEVELAAESASTVHVEAVDALASLSAPTPVLRHWSHGSAEVYEGGERRILQVEYALLDAAGVVRASKVVDAVNGLDVAMTASELAALAGHGGRTPVLPEPAPVPQPAAAWDVLAAFEAALAVGATMLGRALR